MIEGDINERMAQFAPSQNMDPALDVIRQRRGLLPPSTVAPSVAEMPEVAPQAGPDPIVDMLLERRKDRMNATLYGAMRVDPDQAARAQKLAPDVGVGPDMVMRHLPDMERQAKIADIERRRLYMNDPVLSNFLEQKEFAEVAHDDVGTLSKVKGIIGGIAAIPQSVSEGFRRGIATYELADLLDRQRQRGGSVDVIEKAAIESINEEIAALGKESGFWESAANIVTLNLAQAPEYVEPIVTGGVVGGAAGATLGLGGGPLAPATVPAGMATGIVLGLKSGAVTGAFESSRRLETALLYGQALEEGLDHDAANKVALAGGAVSGLLELVGVGIAGKAYSLAVKQVIRRSMNEALKNRTKMAVLREAGLLYVGGGLGETATEVAQEIVNQTAIEAGKFMRDKPMIFNDPEEMQAFGDRLVDTAIETAQGMALIGLPGAGVQIYTGTRRAAKAEQQQQVIMGLVENRKESGLAKRNEVAYERFLAGQTNGTPAETIYIDGTVAQQVLAQSGVTVAELEEIVPGIRQRIVEAVSTGGDVTIPTAQFGARLANTDLGTAMLPHVRLSPDAMSMTEAQEFNARRQETVREAEQILAQKQEADGTFVSEARDIEDTLAAQIVATGQMDEKAARTSAQFMRDFYVTQAAALGITPRQVYERFPVRVEGAMPAVATPLEQADQFDQAGQRRTDTPEFKTWSNDAPVIANEQLEAHEFTTGTPVVVEALHGSTERGLRRFDVGRAVEVPGAIFFTSNPAVAEQYTYERAYGEIISEQPTGDVIRAYVAFANPMVYQPKGKVVDAIEMGRAIEQAKAAGHDGLIIKNIDDSIGMTGDMGDVYVTWNPTSIKSVNNRGTWSRSSPNIMEQAATMDAEYMAAVGRSDMETAQRMVDEAAQMAGFDAKPVWHGTNTKFDVFDLRKSGEGRFGKGFYFTADRERAVAYANNAVLRKGGQAYVGQYYLRNAFNYRDSIFVVTNPANVKSADAVTRDEFGNVVPLSRRFDITSPRIFEQAAVPSQLDAQHRDAIKAGDIDTAQSLTDAVAENRMPDSQVRDANGKILRVFHGTQRIDRVGNRLLKKRATSGPMPFFTNTRPIAEGYAQGKEDTSIEDIGYEQWIKYKPKGSRSRVTLDRAWFYLTPEQRATATERLFTVGYQNPDEGTGPIVDNTDTISSRDHVQYLLREARGNALTAAKELWLNSGSLFNDEQQFMDVLKGMGLTERFVYDSPRAVNSGIIEAYLNITNPLDTAAIPASVVEALQRRADRSRRPAAQYGRDIWDKETRNPQEWMATLRSDIAEGKTQAWTSIPDWVTDVLRGLGYDGIKDMGGKFGGEQHTVWIPFEPEQVKFADAIAKDASGRLIPLSERFDLTSPMMYRQAAAAPKPRGGFDPKRLTTILTKTADLSTFLHESAHAFLTFYEQVAATPDAPARIVSDMDELLRWFKIDGATPAERLAKWNGLTLDQKRQYHETFAYNFEVYLFEGKAPSVEMQGLFERFSVWLKRVYRSIRDDLNAIYRREFGEDLPILTGEVRQVMDRMLATDEQIRRQAAINEMKPAFETQEQSKMNDAEWAAYKAMEQEAIEASITDMNKASLRQMQWLSNARSRIVRDMQRKHDRQRKEVSAEVAAAVRVEPVYRAMTYLRTGKFIDADGTEIAVEGPHRLDIKRIKEIYETVPTAESLEPLRATGMPVPTVVQPDLAKLGTGSYGMMGLDGLDPDLVAETFGYSSGDELIRALVAAKPMKEEVAARTDAEMLRRYGDMNTPEAVEAEVQKSLHNEARARMLAVELRWRTKATQPVRVMLEAAKQVARDLIAGKRIRDVRPSDFVAAEARASRDIQRLQNLPDPVAIGMAAQTRAMNDRLTKGMDNATAMAEAIVEGAKAAQAAEERNAALKAQYGADPQQALIRASRAQLYQNQLAAEALRVQDEVAKDIKYLRRVLRDENVKRMGAPAADQIAGLLERYEVAPVSLKRLDERRALTEWLAQQAELGLVPDIAPEIVNEARRVNYREVKVSEFRDLVDAIRQIEHIGKRERNAAQEKLRAKFDALKDEAIQSMKDVAAKRGRKARKELGDEDRKWSQLIAGYDAMQQTIGSIVYVLDGGQRDGPLARMLLFTANDAGNQETTDRADATLALSKILDPIERKGQFSGRKLYFPQIDDSLSLEQRMVVALNYGNQSNIDRLLNGEKWTEEQVQPILESLTEEQLNAVQAIWNYVESFKPRVAAQERNLLGREPNWIEPRPFTVRSADGKIVNMAGGYYPAKYNPRRSSMSREMDESVEADRQMREAITAATTTRSYTKNRSDKPPEGGVLSRQMGGLYAGVNEVIHDLAWRTWAMDANRLLRDKEFQTVINSIYGRETYAAIKNWVDATVRGERGNYDVIENIAIGVRRNVSVSAMGLKFITAAIQVTGLIPATVRTGITPMVRAVAYFAANPRESSRIAREKSSFMRNRGRTRYRDLNEIANIVRGESRARRAYLANAYALIGLQQGMVDMSVWWAAYSKAIKEGKAEEMAVSIADQTVIDTQGSGMLKDLSQAMRGGQKQSAYAKLFTSFYQFSNTQYALLSAQLRTAPSMGKAAADAFMILVVGAFIEEMLRTLLKPSPDDEEPEDLAKALIANQIDFVIGLPFGGGELRGIGDMIVGEQAMQYRGPSGLRMVGEVRTFAGQTLQGEFDRAWTRSAINMSGLIWGIPSAQINDTIDGINAAVEGEVEGAEAVLAPITGVRR